MNNRMERYPINGTFELTGRCNLSCKMCLVRVDKKRMQELKMYERTAEEWIHMAEQTARAGTLNLLLTGGEVMLRQDFCEIYEAIAQMGFLLTIYTNATLVTDKVMAVFRKFPPHKIGVTMYGTSNETYRVLCGCGHGYNHFCEGVERLMELPSLFDLRTTIVKDNVQDLEGMKLYAKELLGDEKRLHISRFVCKAVRGGVCHPEDARLSPEDSVRYTESYLLELSRELEESPVKKKFFTPNLIKTENTLKNMKEGQYMFQSCRAGIDQYSISWAGRMYACELLTEGYTEPFKDGFDYAWEHLAGQYPRRRIIDQCEKCKFRVTCETCPANRLAETGDWFGIPEYACREARYKYKLFSNMGIVK